HDLRVAAPARRPQLLRAGPISRASRAFQDGQGLSGGRRRGRRPPRWTRITHQGGRAGRRAGGRAAWDSQYRRRAPARFGDPRAGPVTRNAALCVLHGFSAATLSRPGTTSILSPTVKPSTGCPAPASVVARNEYASGM